MLYNGSCKCKRWRLEMQVNKSLEALNPRVCDCGYCKANPSTIISDPNMSVLFTGDGFFTRQNGDQLAKFYYCNGCKSLLAVGCDIDGRLRGAVNSNLLEDKRQLGKPVEIKPRLLGSERKLERWNELWGVLSGL